MASRKIKPGNLEAAISGILEEYRGEIDGDLEKAVHDVAKAGAKELKAVSRSTFGGTGRYASGWSVTDEKGRVQHLSVIYNKTPGLPHLLEHGHALRSGGRSVGSVAGRPHIAPVEEKIIEQFEKELIDEIQRG